MFWLTAPHKSWPGFIFLVWGRKCAMAFLLLFGINRKTIPPAYENFILNLRVSICVWLALQGWHWPVAISWWCTNWYLPYCITSTSWDALTPYWLLICFSSRFDRPIFSIKSLTDFFSAVCRQGFFCAALYFIGMESNSGIASNLN